MFRVIFSLQIRICDCRGRACSVGRFFRHTGYNYHGLLLLVTLPEGTESFHNDNTGRHRNSYRFVTPIDRKVHHFYIFKFGSLESFTTTKIQINIYRILYNNKLKIIYFWFGFTSHGYDKGYMGTFSFTGG